MSDGEDYQREIAQASEARAPEEHIPIGEEDLAGPAIFIGNIPARCTEAEIVQLFASVNKQVQHCDIKPNFAFVTIKGGDADIEEAIAYLKGKSLDGNHLKVERAHGHQKPRDKQPTTPNKTLFVVNFPPETSTQALQDFFQAYGNLLRVDMRKRYAFVEFVRIEDATDALKRSDGTNFLGQPLIVQYCTGQRDRTRRHSGQGAPYGRSGHYPPQPPAWPSAAPYPYYPMYNSYPYPYGAPPPSSGSSSSYYDYERDYRHVNPDDYYRGGRKPSSPGRRSPGGRSPSPTPPPHPPPSAAPSAHMPPSMVYPQQTAGMHPPRRSTGSRGRYDRDYRPSR